MSKKRTVLVMVGWAVAIGVVALGVVGFHAQSEAQVRAEKQEHARLAYDRLQTEWLSFKQQRLIAAWRRQLNTAKARVVDEQLDTKTAVPDPALATIQQALGTRALTLTERAAAIQQKIDQAPQVCDGQIEAAFRAAADNRKARAQAMTAAGVEDKQTEASDDSGAARAKLGQGMCLEWFDGTAGVNAVPVEMRMVFMRQAEQEANSGVVAHYTLADAERDPMASAY